MLVLFRCESCLVGGCFTRVLINECVSLPLPLSLSLPLLFPLPLPLSLSPSPFSSLSPLSLSLSLLSLSRKDKSVPRNEVHGIPTTDGSRFYIPPGTSG